MEFGEERDQHKRIRGGEKKQEQIKKLREEETHKVFFK